MVMTDRSERGSPKPRGAERLERDDVIWEAIRGVHQGQQPCCAARTGRTHGCTRPVLIARKPLAPQGPSTHGFTATSSHSYAGAGAVHPIRSGALRARSHCKGILVGRRLQTGERGKGTFKLCDGLPRLQANSPQIHHKLPRLEIVPHRARVLPFFAAPGSAGQIKCQAPGSDTLTNFDQSRGNHSRYPE